MRPQRDDIAAPELPGRLRWHNAPRAPTIAELTAAGPVLVHFFDFAQLNSVRALPYAIEWGRRYREAGLATLGVHSPRFPFTARRESLGPALKRLGISHPVADDAGYAVWHDYGCKGWPSLFLWRRGGALGWFHFGEGEYRATEEAIQAELRELDPLANLPEPMAPLRATDAPGALVAPPTEELLPGGSEGEPWRPGADGEELELDYEAGGAHASVDGGGELRVSIDGGPERAIGVGGPGLYELAVHPRHEHHRLGLSVSAGVDLYSVSFSAGLP
jgi:hypothetical protein